MNTEELSDAALTYRLKKARGEALSEHVYLTGAFFTCEDYARKQGWERSEWRHVSKLRDIHTLQQGTEVIRLWAPKGYYDDDFWGELLYRAVVVNPPE